ncbi:MAG TPA: pyridoxal-dependent decarboxylase [Kofleriaceae bacterium]|nr:pyridoxal-dependent decarboxylase [Kofleriaceae bacterium]
MLELGPVPASIAAAYDAERFRADGHRLIDRMADHLAAATGRDDAPVIPWVAPADAAGPWPADFGDEPAEDLVDVLDRTAAGSIRLHHPRYLGHQVPPPIPGAALADAMAALLNNGMAVYEMGGAATPQELAVIDWMARTLGLPATAGGLLTSGGSAGNLTALLAARQASAGFDAWTAGAHAGPPLTVLVAATAHYSVARAVRALGWGDAGATPVAVDARWRLDPADLPRALADATAAGRRVIAVVASAGSTATGAYDPLEPIADFCAAHRLWLHVDGAHGAAAALSPRHRHHVRGIERADSVVWDAHKLLALPALCTAVIYRDVARSYEAFAQEASYLFAPEREWWNLGLRTLECTKRMMGTILYAGLRAYGVGFFRDYVERVFALGQAFAARLAAAPDFELATHPDANIVVFRYRPASGPSDPAELDALQARVRRRCLEAGRFYFLQTRLGGALWLRTALMNPLTAGEELDGVLAAIRQA